MRASVFVVSLAVSACITIIPTTASADGECYKGYRDTTPGERAAMTKVLESALRALPPPPDGWVLNSDDSLYVTSSVCRDDENQPWSYDFSRAFLRVDDVEARDAKLGDAGARIAADMKSKQPRMDAVMAKIQELSMQAVAAAEKADYDKVDAINVEIEKASAEMERIMAEGGTMELADAANDEASRDTNIRIEVDVNSGHGLFGYGAEKTTVPAGADGAYRWRDAEGSNVNETRMILFGQWRTDGEAFDPVFRAGAAPTAAQTISISVTADVSRIDSVVDSIDFAVVAASVSR